MVEVMAGSKVNSERAAEAVTHLEEGGHLKVVAWHYDERGGARCVELSACGAPERVTAEVVFGAVSGFVAEFLHARGEWAYRNPCPLPAPLFCRHPPHAPRSTLHIPPTDHPHFLRSDLTAAMQVGDPSLLAAASCESLWKRRCRDDLGVVRAGTRHRGFYRRLYLEVVEEQCELENSVGMGH